MDGERFVVEVARSTAAELHAWEPPSARRVARWCEVSAPALVLGSAQPDSSVDLAACAADGIDVVRRRSGGGAVLMLPGEIEWLDVVVPAGDPLWHDDVGKAMWWLGDVWAHALQTCGLSGTGIHTGPLIRSRWSSVVCFDGLGPGEVLVGGTKAVGISQRRTRGWLRLQTAIHRHWRPEAYARLLAVDETKEFTVREPFCLEDEHVVLVRQTVEQLLDER